MTPDPDDCPDPRDARLVAALRRLDRPAPPAMFAQDLERLVRLRAAAADDGARAVPLALAILFALLAAALVAFAWPAWRDGLPALPSLAPGVAFALALLAALAGPAHWRALTSASPREPR
jgi:hypothetical protein